MAGLLAIIVMFIRPIFSAVLTVTKIPVSSGQLGILYTVIAIFVYVYFVREIFLKNEGKLNKPMAITILVLLAVIGAMLITIYRNGSNHDATAALKSFGSTTVCASLLGIKLATDKEEKLTSFCKWIPVLVLMITLITATSTFGGETTGNGLTMDTNSINYQTASYYAAYALGLNLFYLDCYDSIKTFDWLKNIKWLFNVLPFFQIIMCIYAGGRGGFVLMLAVLIMYYILKQKKGITGDKFFSGIIVFAVGLFVAYVVLKTGKSAGINRILGFLGSPNDDGRREIAEEAITVFKTKVVTGYGINSIWYKLGYYSHNIFTDLLVETGVVGTGVVGIILIKTGFALIRLVKKDKNNYIIINLFLFGFMMSLFSGYYLSQPFIWFAIAYALASKKEKRANNNYYYPQSAYYKW